MKVCHLFYLCLFAASLSAQTVIFQDDFETQDFSAWSYITAGSPLTISANGVISTTQVHSGLYSFAATLPATGNAVETAQALSNLTEVYYQVWLYIDPAFTMTDWNESGSALVTQLTISGSPSGSAAVYGEGRNVTISGGILTDTFNDAAVHLYVLPKGTGIPTAPGNLI